MRRAAVGALALLLLAALGGSFLLSSRRDPGPSCQFDARRSPIPAQVAGYRGDQLRNAAAIIAAGAAAGIDSRGQTLAVMVAAGESGLRSLDHGDTAGPDSRGLFQQRASWGSLATRLDPTASARLFYGRLATVRGWQQLAPTAAAHAVQGNADPDYYTRFWAPAEAIVAALTNPAGATTTCAADAGTVIASDPQQLARALTTAIDAGRITGLVPDHLREIRWIAEGRTVPNCGVDTRILQIITVALDTFHRLGISDINRRCTGQLLGAGVESSHFIDGGGHAVDFYALAGHPITGADADSLALIRTLDPLVPSGARIGQQQCRRQAGTETALTHFREFDDTCNHLHVDVAYTSSPLSLPNRPDTEPAVLRAAGAPAAATFDQAVGLRATLRAAPAGRLLLPAGTFALQDFQADLHGADLPAAGLQGAGSSRTVIAMTPTTSTRAGDVPTRAFTTNQLDLLALTGGSPQLGGFTLRATDQHHLYNGLRVAKTTALRAGDITVVGVPGAANYPPGETFAINDWRTTGSVWSGLTIDAAGVGAAGFGSNSSRDVTVRDSSFTGTRYSAGLALWQTTTIHLDHVQVIGNAAGINIERSGGAITLDDCTFADNGRYDLQFMTDLPGADVTITDPVLAPGQRLRIHLPARYHGVANQQQRSTIRVLVHGVDQTASLVDWN